MALTNKKRLFVEKYIACGFNGAEAVRQAGYTAQAPQVTACEILRDPEVQSLIDERLDAESMRASEVLKHLTDLARGRYAETFEVYGNGVLIRWDPEKAQQLGLLNTIKKVKPTAGGYEVEFWDRVGPLNSLAKAHGLLKDRVETDVRGAMPLEFVNDWRGAGVDREAPDPAALPPSGTTDRSTTEGPV